MRLTFLGTGASEGIPVPGCTCPVCRDARRPGSRNCRLRTSIMLEKGGKTVIVDTSPDFRTQVLRENVARLDAVLFTHLHADHTAGIADLRDFARRPTLPLPTYVRPVDVYGDERMVAWLHRSHPWIDAERYPVATIHALSPLETVEIAGFSVTPIPVWHGELGGFISGYALDGLLYLTDVKEIPGSPFHDPDWPMPPCPYDSWSYIRTHRPRCLVLDLLEHQHGTKRYNRCISHLTVEEIVPIARAIGAEKTWFIHMNHSVSEEELEGEAYARLSLFPSWDGLRVEVPDVR